MLKIRCSIPLVQQTWLTLLIGEIPSFKLFESDKVFAFLDIQPLAYGHAVSNSAANMRTSFKLDRVPCCMEMRIQADRDFVWSSSWFLNTMEQSWVISPMTNWPKFWWVSNINHFSHASMADLSPQPVAKSIAKAIGAEDYNILQNNGRLAHQLVDHVHFHVVSTKPPLCNTLWRYLSASQWYSHGSRYQSRTRQKVLE